MVSPILPVRLRHDTDSECVQMLVSQSPKRKTQWTTDENQLSRSHSLGQWKQAAAALRSAGHSHRKTIVLCVKQQNGTDSIFDPLSSDEPVFSGRVVVGAMKKLIVSELDINVLYSGRIFGKRIIWHKFVPVNNCKTASIRIKKLKDQSVWGLLNAQNNPQCLIFKWGG